MTYDLSTLRDLLVRVEAAENGGDELDARIRCALFAPAGAYVERSHVNGAWCVYYGEDRSGRPRLASRLHSVSHDLWRGSYSSSIDAACAKVADAALAAGSRSAQTIAAAIRARKGGE